VLHLDCRPRGFSPPRRFGFHLRSGNFAPQPDRIHIVSSYPKSLSTPGLGPDHRNVRHRTLPTQRDLRASRLTHLAMGSLSAMSNLTRLPKKPGPTGPMDAAPHENRPKWIPRRLGSVRKASLPDVRAPFEERHSLTASSTSLSIPAPSPFALPLRNACALHPARTDLEALSP
jgi:hypothetical protein